MRPETGVEVYVSVIVPAHRAASTIEACLHPLLHPHNPAIEVIVVDDHSPDDVAAIARRMGARVATTMEGRGPAAARNTGARLARGEVLMFVDADVVVTTRTVEQMTAIFRGSPHLHALFGSYDPEPHAPGFVSQYRNLLHHFVHQSSEAASRSFWAGCGAVRANAFRAVGGFDAVRYPEPSIEDIDLGRRLSLAGYTIRLEKTLQVKHLKRWTLASMLATDVRRRAYPWSQMILQSGSLRNDLNLRPAHRLSAALVGVACLAIGALVLPVFNRHLGVRPAALAVLVTALSGVIGLNWPFYRFLADRGRRRTRRGARSRKAVSKSVITTYTAFTAAEIGTEVFKAVERHANDSRFADDLTILILKRRWPAA